MKAIKRLLQYAGAAFVGGALMSASASAADIDFGKPGGPVTVTLEATRTGPYRARNW